MWVSKCNKWPNQFNAYEKFAVERIIQRSDFSEIISNKHKSINGFSQLKELIRLADLSFTRGRTVKTLIAILEESKSKFIKQNIVNDVIIKKYFSDLKNFIQNYDANKLIGPGSNPNLTEVKSFLHKLSLFEVQAEKYYYEFIKKELESIDENDFSHFEKTANYISDLIDLLVPYLIFRGYSIASISGLLIRTLQNDKHISLKKLLSIFDFRERHYTFYIIFEDGSDEIKTLIEILSKEIPEISQNKTISLDKFFIQKFGFKGDEILIQYNLKTIDPNSHIRSLYDQLLKRVVVGKERRSLVAFSKFFDSCFWGPHNKVKSIQKISLEGDSINVNSRGKTLRTTLNKISKKNEHDLEDYEIPITYLEQLNNAIFYYNLALGSKSIENSLSLLWTSLEAILPYRTVSSDIENVQYFVSKSLSLGAISRDINGFASRFIQQNQQNENQVGDTGTITFDSHYSSKGILQWFNWMTNKNIAEMHFEKIKNCSELLAYQYSKIGKTYALEKSEYAMNRIVNSKESIKYQLQRIYIHRNQIVHAGDFINEYTNLWMNLEWYVGKILAYFIYTIQINKQFDTIEEAGLQLEADYDYLISYLDKNKNKSISEIPLRIKEIIFSHNWQSF